MKIIAIAITVAILLVVGIFYYVLKNKSTEVADKMPYSAILNKQLVTKTEAFILKIDPNVSNLKENVLKHDSSVVFGEQLLCKVPQGAILNISKAIHYTKSVSGITYSLLIGKVWIQELKKEIEFEYQWGEHHFLCVEEPCNYWTFPQAIWQETADSTKYFYN
ncbi:MAG: hypothetical protein WBM13_08085 [Bacteroidia bacterium]